MPKRTSPKDIEEIADLNNLDKIVVDKRRGKRADAKKERRNRHYTKLLIKEQLLKGTESDGEAEAER